MLNLEGGAGWYVEAEKKGRRLILLTFDPQVKNCLYTQKYAHIRTCKSKHMHPCYTDTSNRAIERSWAKMKPCLCALPLWAISTALSAGNILTTSSWLTCQTVTCTRIHQLSTLSTQERRRWRDRGSERGGTRRGKRRTTVGRKRQR